MLMQMSLKAASLVWKIVWIEDWLDGAMAVVSHRISHSLFTDHNSHRHLQQTQRPDRILHRFLWANMLLITL